MKYLSLIFISAYLSIFPTLSEARTTEKLAKQCVGSGALESDQIFCAGYIDGFLDSHAIISGLHESTKLFCLPKSGISIDQALLIFLEYVNKNPKSFDKTARVTLTMSLIKSFPCPTPKK
ncbi:MAG: hypothetical protein JKY45_08090 [Emcibacter sp.]|nr:hypothetical protein [Emcibacter sp.]